MREKTESRSWLETNLSRVSRHFEEIKFQKLDRVRPFPDEAAARFSFLRDNVPHEGVALCSIFEKSGVLYVMASGRETFEAERGRLQSFLESFRFEIPEAGEPTTASGPKIAFAPWQDPIERAFTLEVPQGWTVSGGTYRRAAVDLIHVLQVASPYQKLCLEV